MGRKAKSNSANFRLLRRIRPRVLATFVIVALVAAASGYWIVNDSHAASGYTICMSNDHSLCLVSHGAYNELSVGSSGKALWARTSLGNSIYMFHNGAGNCLRVANDGYKVEVGAGGCSSNIAADRWVIYGNPAKYGNQGHNCYMAVKNYGSQLVFCSQSTSDYITYNYKWVY
jgi:hypothetical protein